MDDATSGRRTCEVCGRPIQRNNTTGICTGLGMTAECRRVRAERQRRALGVKPKKINLCQHPDGCTERACRHGYCLMHAARLRTTGKLGPRDYINKPTSIHADDTFGRWTTLEDYGDEDYRVLCRCECGTERRVTVASLKNGTSRSCGCLHRSIVRRARKAEPYMLPGEVHGRLTALEQADLAASLIRFHCECGADTVKRATSVRSGNTQSCGCLNRENHTTHGLSGHPLFHTWAGMISRCQNPAIKNYADYGGRGITVCEAWQGAPEGFLRFVADVGERPEGHSLDRTDNDGGYWCGRCAECARFGRPANTAWRTRAEQNSNRRSIGKLTRERDALAERLGQVEALLASRSRKPVTPAQDALF